MNLPLSLSQYSSVEPAARLEAWIYQGLLHFWQHALPVDHAIYQLLQWRAHELLAVKELPSWTGDWPWPPGYTGNIDLPLNRLITDYQLTPASLFVLALTGHLETAHLANLAVAELQAPDRTPRLSLHLASALVQTLFGESPQQASVSQLLGPIEIATHNLVTGRVLDIHGEGPLPLQRLQICPWLWALLLGSRPYWPEVRLLSESWTDIFNPALNHEIDILARLLEHRSMECAGLVLRGSPYSGRSACAQALANRMNLMAVDIPLDVWLKQPALIHACRYSGWLPVLRIQTPPAQGLGLSRLPVPVVVILPSDQTLQESNMLELTLDAPVHQDRRMLWRRELAGKAQHHDVLCEQLAGSARLSARAIQWIAGSAHQIAARQQEPLGMAHIAQARAQLGVDKLRLLAQPVLRQVGDDALVVPSLVKENLQLLLKRAHQRESLWSGLGSTLSVTPNPGVRALFVGESGTGKTLAASYIATSLSAPLYRVDLSAVMNKYIGESEKNLAQLLDQAAASDVVLLFDEADALFGSRSDGQETGERFANMLTNFLLTRIETHPGIVILTTNSRERIDTAFSRRLDLIVEFPMPDFEERLNLWRSHLGERGPGEAVYRNLSSYCDLAGGQLRNVVLTAAVVAGDNPITSAHLLEGLRAEYRKQGRDLPYKLESLAAS